MSGHTSSDLNDLQRLTRPYDCLGDSVIVADKDGIILYANTAATALYGYAAGELLGKHNTIFDLEGESPIDFESIMKAPDQMWEREVFRVRKDGTEFPSLLNITPFRDLSGEIVGRVGIARDLTKLKEAENAFKKLSQRQSVLAEIGRIISSTLDIHEVYERFVDQVRKVIPLDRIGTCIANEAGDSLIITFVHGVDIPDVRQRDSIPLDGSNPGKKVMESGKGILYGIGEESISGNLPPVQKDIIDAGIRCVICVPLVTNGNSIGVLFLSSLKVDAFNEEHLQFAEQVGNEIAGAVANSQLHAALVKESMERETLVAIGRIIGSSLNIEDVYEQFAEQVQLLIPYDKMAIVLIDPDEYVMVSAYTSGLKVEDRQIGSTLHLSSSLSGRIYDTKSPILFKPESEAEVAIYYSQLIPLYRSGLKTFLGVPLISDDVVVGVLHLNSSEANGYSEDDVDTAQRIATQIAGAIANSQLHADLQKESNEREILTAIGRIVGSSLDIDEVYERFAKLVQQLIPHDRICISLVNEDETSTTAAYASGQDVPRREIDTVVDMDKSISGEVCRQRSGVIFQPTDAIDVESRFPELSPSYESGLRSFLAAPLISNDRVIGVLHVESRTENAFSPRDAKISERVAAQIAGALANARLHADLQRDARERDILAEIGRAVSSSLDIEDVYERFGELVSKLVPLDIIGLGLIDDVNGTVTYRYTRGSAIPKGETGSTVPLDKGISGAVFKGRATILYEPESEAELEGKYPRLVPLYKAGVRSFLTAPLISHDKVIGVLHAHSMKQGVYQERHLAIAGRVAAQVAGAFASSVLHADLQRDANQRAVLAEIGRIASSSLNLSEVYERIAYQVRELVSFDKATIYLVNENEGTIVATYSSGLEVDERPIGKIESIHGSMTNDAFQSASSRLVQTEDETWFAEHFPVALPSFRAGLRSFISVPLISDNNVIGALSISSTKPDAYGARDVAATEQVATQIAGAVASSQHYIQRQQAEVALGESMELYRTLLESAPDGVLLTTESGRIELVNARIEAMFGYSRNELIGKKVEILVPASARKDHHKLRLNYEKNPKTRGMGGRLDIIGVRKDGTEFSVDITLSPLRTDRGLLVTSIIRDTTDRRHLEEQLLHSQKMEAVGQLAGGVAHDFNNMLSAIISYTHLAQMRCENITPLSEYLEEVRKAADRASHLTRQLLAFSRRQIVEPRSLNINDIVLELNNMLRRLIGEDIEIVMLPDPDLGFAKVDPGQIEQVIVNLAVNSRDAMPGGGKLTISTFNFTIEDKNARDHSVKEKGDYIGLKVEDTGMGMSEEVRAHIFEPFYTTKEVGKGTGLGLSICYGIAEQNGGSISVESEVGKGTAFTLLLPRLEISQRDSSGMNQSDPLPQGKEKILLVEDEPMVREVTAHVLREQGYTVVEAANGMEAVSAFSEDTIVDIDLLLTDIVMPLMSGRELAEKVKLMHPGIKVLYASGYTDDEIVRQEIMTDDRQFIMKPFTPLTLTKKVREALDRLHPVA